MDKMDSLRPAPARQQMQRLAILLGVVFAILAAGYYVFLRMDYAPLFEGLKPADASAVVSELTEQGVRYHLSDGGATILVESGKLDEARLTVLGSDVSAKGMVGFELFDQSEMGLTDFAQKIKYQRALQGELSRSIMMMAGIETARVHIAIPERAMFRGSEAGPTAAVTIVAADGIDPAPDSIDGIRQLVAAAVPELLPSNVVVLNEQGRILSANNLQNTGSVAPTVMAPHGAGSDEAYYLEKANAALEALMGTGRPDLVLSFEAIPLEPDATPADGVSQPVEEAKKSRMRIAAIGDQIFGEADRARIAAALVAVLPEDAFSVGDLTFLERASGTNIPAAPSETPVSAALIPILESLGFPDRLEMSAILLLFLGVSGLVLVLIFAALLLRRRRKSLTAEEHREFAELLKLEFAPAEGVNR